MGSWNHKEIVALLNILGPDMVEKHSLDSLCNRLHQAFNKSENFKVFSLYSAQPLSLTHSHPHELCPGWDRVDNV